MMRKIGIAINVLMFAITGFFLVFDNQYSEEWDESRQSASNSYNEMVIIRENILLEEANLMAAKAEEEQLRSELEACQSSK